MLQQEGTPKTSKVSGIAILTIGTGDRMVGYFVLPAALATPERIQTLLKEGRGILCVAVDPQRAAKLRLTPQPGARSTGAYTVTIDARNGITTGISAHDRALTIRLIADPHAVAEDFVRPGHILPQVTHPDGVLGRQGPAEGAAHLSSAAGYDGTAAYCAILDESGGIAGQECLQQLASRIGTPIVPMDEIVRTCRLESTPLTRSDIEALPTEFGYFHLVSFRNRLTGRTHYAVLNRPPTDPTHSRELTVPLLFVHKECKRGEVFRSLESSARADIDRALLGLSRHGGILIYVSGTDHSEETVVGTVAAILRDFNITAVRLTPKTAEIADGLIESGISVAVSLPSQGGRAATLAVLSDRS